jgi:PAS domain S-box-containing protein
LIPYFKAGLENNERCLMVAAEPLGAEEVRQALRAAIGDFDRREKDGQIKLLDALDCYAERGGFNAEEIVNGLVRTEQAALAAGYTGLRTNGNIGGVGRDLWDGFQEYESLVTERIAGRRMVSLCSYCLGKCQGSDVLDVVDRHHLTLRNRSGVWTPLPPAESVATPAPPATVDPYRLIEALPAAIYTTDRRGRLTYYNPAAADLWGYRPELGKQVPHDQSPLPVATGTGRPVHRIETIGERPEGKRVPCVVYPTPLFDEAGEVVGSINMLVDISEQKAREEQQSLLLRELEHRVKNNLAIVQAIMGTTLRNSTSLAAFQEAFTDRIRALAKTHTLLTEQSKKSVSLTALLRSELDMFLDHDVSRLTLSGPEVELPPNLAVPVGMALHELATNAVKYGALSMLGGQLAIAWQLSGNDLVFSWLESGVPGVVEPARTGFGTRLLRRLLPGQIQATVDIRFEPDGLQAYLRIPVSADS